ncbi:FMN-binding domain protein [mine drainage metagenome]|uniref:FMN-binding domain protein n=1 Tax=mine drainage metagenome TaxID=410659 RepID=A0A1J5PA62_9ZZZZ
MGSVGVLSFAPGSTSASPLLALPAKSQSSTASSQTLLASSSTTSPTAAKKHKKVTSKHKTKKIVAKHKTKKTTAKHKTKKVVAKHKAKKKTHALAAAATTPSTTSRRIAGSVSQTPFGPVQVQITVQGNKIVKAVALQTPQGGRSSWINQQAVPYLVKETLTAQSANIQGVGGATFTSEAWAQSLQAALAKK